MIPTKHICPTCSKEFFGRLNKKFCCEDCKSDFNNRKAADLKKELPDNKLLQKNYLILKELYPESMGEVGIETTMFYKKGFDFQAPSRKVKTHKYGFECYLNNGYAYRVLNDRTVQQLLIYKSEELDNL